MVPVSLYSWRGDLALELAMYKVVQVVRNIFNFSVEIHRCEFMTIAD